MLGRFRISKRTDVAPRETAGGSWGGRWTDGDVGTSILGRRGRRFQRRLRKARPEARGDRRGREPGAAFVSQPGRKTYPLPFQVLLAARFVKRTETDGRRGSW